MPAGLLWCFFPRFEEWCQLATTIKDNNNNNYSYYYYYNYYYHYYY